MEHRDRRLCIRFQLSAESGPFEAARLLEDTHMHEPPARAALVPTAAMRGDSDRLCGHGAPDYGRCRLTAFVEFVFCGGSAMAGL
jgi:hypothetical protein